MSDYKYHRINQHYLHETRAQAELDRLVRSARPGFRLHLAALLTRWAARLEGSRPLPRRDVHRV